MEAIKTFLNGGGPVLYWVDHARVTQAIPLIELRDEVLELQESFLSMIEENEKLRRALGDIFTYYYKSDLVRQWAAEALQGG